MPSSRPNILMIHADQHRYDCVGANGHPLLKTPALDQLAREGTNFSHAFTPIPICSPARASLLTGAWPSQHGCLTIPYCCEMFSSADPKLPVFTRLLADAGYYNAWMGRFHAEVQGQPPDYGVHDYIPDWRYKKWREAQGLPPRTEGAITGVDTGVTSEQSRPGWEASEVINLLRNRPADQPFFIRWDPLEPHGANYPPEPYASMYDPNAIAPWPSFPDPFINKPYAQRKQQWRWMMENWKWEDFQPHVARYLGDISNLDAQIGRVLKTLDELDLRDNTLVIYSCDHGDMTGGHGYWDKHFCMYEDNMHVPLIMRWPGQIPVGKTCDALVSSELDFGVTFLRAAGVTPPESFVGRDLKALATGTDPHPRDVVFSQYFGTQQGLFSSRMARDYRYKYVYNATDVDELYDLHADPGELHNLIDDAQQTATLERLRGAMQAWMKETGDHLSPPGWRWTKVRSGRA